MHRHRWSDLGLGGTGQSDGERSNGGGGFSNGWLFFDEQQLHSCNVGRQQRYWKMTVGIGARGLDRLTALQ